MGKRGWNIRNRQKEIKEHSESQVPCIACNGLGNYKAVPAKVEHVKLESPLVFSLLNALPVKVEMNQGIKSPFLDTFKSEMQKAP